MSHSLIAAWRAASQGLRRKESSTWGRDLILSRRATRSLRRRVKTAAIEAEVAPGSKRSRRAS